MKFLLILLLTLINLSKQPLSHQRVASFGSVDFLFTLHCLAIGNWRAFYFVQSDTGISAYFYQYKKAREKQRSARTQEGRYIDAINKFLIGFIDLKLNSKKCPKLFTKRQLCQ